MKQIKGLLIVTLVACCVTIALAITTILSYKGKFDPQTTAIPSTSSTELKTSNSEKEKTPTSEASTASKKETSTKEASTSSPTNDGILKTGATYVVKNTPDGKGSLTCLDLTPDCEDKGFLKEGTEVVVISDDATNKTGYVYAGFYSLPDSPGSYLEGYVEKKYLVLKDDNIIGNGSDVVHVSYNTPGHEGLNMTEKPDSSSASVHDLKEGMPVEIVYPYDPSNNGYVYVCFDEDWLYHEKFYGWVLYEHLVM